MKQYEEKMKAKERRRRSNQNAIDLAREQESIEVDAKRIAKQAAALTLKQERIQEKIDKLKEQQERHKRGKVSSSWQPPFRNYVNVISFFLLIVSITMREYLILRQGYFSALRIGLFSIWIV